MKALLISNSGRPYLEHCRTQIVETLSGCKLVGFISAAFFGNEGDYFRRVVDGLGNAPFQLRHVQTQHQPLDILSKCDALMVGGGNTYRLLKYVREAKLLPEIKKRVLSGMPYVGWSAGSNLAGPTILTTNDWNVVGLTQFDALGLVPFNINPHYIETDPGMAQFSETRDERIAEYHRVNANTVLGVEEQTMLWIQNNTIRVIGEGKVRRFDVGKLPVDFRNAAEISLSSLK